MKSKIVNLQELQAALKNQFGKTVACTCGCFDILHAGHVQYLEDAKSCADILIVMLNSDSSVKNLKGQGRPVVNQQDRALVLAGLQSVDYIIIFDEDTPCGLLSKIKPDFFVKGGDYKGKHIPEEDVLQSYGGKIKFVDFLENHSSTEIINKIGAVCK